MKKKIVTCCLIALTLVFCLAACGASHEHKYSSEHDETYHWQECEVPDCPDKIVHKEPHNNSGSDGQCTVCTYKKPAQENPPETHSHVWSQTWEKDGTHHWRKCTVEGCTEKDGYDEHDFTSGNCVCGKENSTVPETGDTAFKNVSVSESGILSWNKIKGASKYVLKVTYAAESNSVEYDIDKSKTSVNLSELRSEGLPVGKSKVELIAYENAKVEIDGQTGYQEIPMTDVKESVRIIKSNGKISFVRLTYSDANIKLDGFYAEKETVESRDCYLYEQVLKDNKPMNFKIRDYVKATANHSVVYYKSEEGRNNGVASDVWNSSELQMGYPQLQHGANFYYVRVTDTETGDTADYNLCVYGLYALTIQRFNISFTEAGGLREYTQTQIGEDLKYNERDILPQDILYGDVENGKLARTENYKVVEREDITLGSSSTGIKYYFYDETTVRSDCEIYEEWSKTYNLSEYAQGWSLSCNYNKATGMVTLPDIIIGKKVISASFDYSDITALVVEEGAQTLTARFTACWKLLDIFLPGTITDMPKNSFSGVNTNATVHCAFTQSTANAFPLYWDRNEGGAKITIEYGVSVPSGALTIENGLVYAAAGQEDEVSVVSVLGGFDGEIPETVTYDGVTYKVTGIDVVLVGFDTITLSKNIKVIADGALAEVRKVIVAEDNQYFTVKDELLYNNDFSGFLRIADKSKAEELTELTIDARVRSIAYGALSDFYNLESLTIPFVGASSAGEENTHFGYIFGASSYSVNGNYVSATLKTVIVSGGASIDEYAFCNCGNLESVTLPESVTEIAQNAFYGCNGLESVTVDENNLNYSSQSGILYDKAKTQFIHIPKAIKGTITIPDSVTEIDSSTFDGCSGIESVTVDENNLNYSSQDGILYDKEKTQFIHIPKGVTGSVTIPDGVTVIPSKAFQYCYGINELTIHDNITEIGKDAFDGCDNIITACIPTAAISALPKTKLENVTVTSGRAIGRNAFKDCYNLKSITISDTVESIDKSAFAGCYKLEDTENGIIYVDKWVVDCGNMTTATLRTDTVGICDSAFENSSIQSIVIPDSVKHLGARAFAGCKVKSITIPGSVTSIGGSAFAACTSLISVTIGNGVTSIGENAFNNCNQMKSITIPESVTTIEKDAFMYCNRLENLFIESISSWCNIDFANDYAYPMNVFSILDKRNLYVGETLVTDLVIPAEVNEINKCFAYCTSIQSVTLSDRVTSIGGSAFYNCSGLTSINYNGTKEQWNEIPKGNYWNSYTGDYTIHCTDGDVTR